VLGEARDADAGADLEGDRIRLEGMVECREDASRDHLGLGLRAAHEHGEFVTADPRQQVRVADGLLQTPRHPLDDLVPQLVAERVVDRLEVVDVQQHHRHRAAVVLGDVQGFLKGLGQRGAVRQAGQHVVMGAVARDRRLSPSEVHREHRHEADRNERHTHIGGGDQGGREGQHAAGRPGLEGQVIAQVADDRQAR